MTTGGVSRFVSIAAAICALAALAPSFALAESQLKDSDDWNCNHGALEDPRTLRACINLRGAPVTVDEIARDRRMGFQRASDDWNCHHARPGSHRRMEACRRLRGE